MSAGLEALEKQGLLRQRNLHSQSLIDFAGNDYLGLANCDEIAQATVAALAQTACGSGASPLVNGYSAEHKALEQALCERTGHEAALLFCSGFSANQALIKTLFAEADTLLADRLIHASVIDGIKDSGARFRRFHHNDIANAESLMARLAPAAVITESVFSMDGDCAPLAELKSLTHKHNAWLIVDDAHGFATPKGGMADCDASLADVQLVTFGKALGCQGAALLGGQLFVDYMVANCRHYIYSTALSPLAAATALAALNLCASDARQQKLADNIALFKRLSQSAGIKALPSNTAIQPVLIGDNLKVLDFAARLKQSGFLVGAIRPPTVPVGSARLRITLSARHTQKEIEDLILALSQPG